MKEAHEWCDFCQLKLISETVAEVRLAKSDNAVVVRCFGKHRSQHALNSIQKSSKLQNNWFKCEGLGKRHRNTCFLIYLPNAIFPP